MTLDELRVASVVAVALSFSEMDDAGAAVLAAAAAAHLAANAGVDLETLTSAIGAAYAQANRDKLAREQATGQS